jgi:HEAT repeat protein
MRHLLTFLVPIAATVLKTSAASALPQGPFGVGLAGPRAAPAARPSDDSPTADERQRTPPSLGAVDQIVRQARGLPKEEHAALVEKLAKLGPVCLEACMYLLEHGALEESAEGPRRALNRWERALLVQALGRLAWEDVQRELDRALELRGQQIGLRVAAIEILGSLGPAQAVERMLALGLCAEEQELPRQVEPALVAGIEALARRHGPACFEQLAFGWAKLSLPLVEAALQGLGRARDPRALGLLGDSLRWHPGLDALSVSQIALVGRGDDSECARGVAEMLRHLLDPERPHLAAGAARALASLEDADSLPELVALVASDVPAVRDGARAALETFAGVQFHGDVARQWEAWWSAERTWYDLDRLDLQRKLNSGDQTVAVAAALALAQHKVFRHELASDLAETFTRRQGAERVVLARALGILGSRSASSALIEVLDGADRSLAQAAAEALEAIHRLQLPPEKQAWEMALSARR